MAEIQTLEATPLTNSSRSALSMGSKGTAVSNLQKDLKSWGFDPGATDGIFGQQTQQAVMAMQRRLGVTADGIVGPATLAAMTADLKSASSRLKTGAQVISMPVSLKLLPATSQAIPPGFQSNPQGQSIPSEGQFLPPEGEAAPFYKQKWFMPAAIGGAVVLFMLLRKNPSAPEQTLEPATNINAVEAELDALMGPPKKKRRKKRAKKVVAANPD
jgi:hypothetical protein